MQVASGEVVELWLHASYPSDPIKERSFNAGSPSEILRSLSCTRNGILQFGLQNRRARLSQISVIVGFICSQSSGVGRLLFNT